VLATPPRRRPTRTRALYRYLSPAESARLRRDLVILDLLERGWSARLVAEVLLLSESRVRQIARLGSAHFGIRRAPPAKPPRGPRWLEALRSAAGEG
jgi:hypothetical protein